MACGADACTSCPHSIFFHKRLTSKPSQHAIGITESNRTHPPPLSRCPCLSSYSALCMNPNIMALVHIPLLLPITATSAACHHCRCCRRPSLVKHKDLQQFSISLVVSNWGWGLLRGEGGGGTLSMVLFARFRVTRLVSWRSCVVGQVHVKFTDCRSSPTRSPAPMQI